MNNFKRVIPSSFNLASRQTFTYPLLISLQRDALTDFLLTNGFWGFSVNNNLQN